MLLLSVACLADEQENVDPKAKEFAEFLEKTVIATSYGSGELKFRLMPGGIVTGRIPMNGRYIHLNGAAYQWSISSAKRRMIVLKNDENESFLLTINPKGDAVVVHGASSDIICKKQK